MLGIQGYACAFTLGLCMLFQEDYAKNYDHQIMTINDHLITFFFSFVFFFSLLPLPVHFLSIEIPTLNKRKSQLVMSSISLSSSLVSSSSKSAFSKINYGIHDWLTGKKIFQVSQCHN